MEITKEDWIETRINNERMLKINLMQNMMAEEVINLCQTKILEFPEEVKDD